MAVVVTYRPELDLLTCLFDRVLSEVGQIVVVCNDSERPDRIPINAKIIDNNANIGLGAAYNLAVRWAREHGATHLLLLDQDSVPAPGMVASLMEVFQQAESPTAFHQAEPASAPLQHAKSSMALHQNEPLAVLQQPAPIAALRHSEPVAAVGPLWRDSRTGEDGFFVRLTRWGAQKIQPVPGAIVPVDFLISSGSLISLQALEDIGPFDENLFIEHVDTDFALRARAKGYRLYGVAGARLDHAFGEATMIASPLGLRRRFFLYPPSRNYYLLRNSIVLWHRSYAPWPWVWHDLRRTVTMILFYALFVPPRWQRLKQLARAIRDAWRL